MDCIDSFEICFEDKLKDQNYHQHSILEDEKNSLQIILKQKALVHQLKFIS